jgi:hypothetical protein
MSEINSSISGAAYDKLAVYLGFNPELSAGTQTPIVHLLVQKYRIGDGGAVERCTDANMDYVFETNDNPNVVALRAAVEAALVAFITAEGM